MAVISLSRILGFWADQKPDDTAIVHDDDSITWIELERKTNQLARAYAERGVGQDDFVTIALPNGIEFMAACFATWKLGATPQPVSSSLPRLERNAIVSLAKPALVVGTEEVDGDLSVVPAGFSAEGFSSDEMPERTASNLKAVTSGGSTGRPKLIVTPVPAVCDTETPNLIIPYESTVLVPGPLYHNGPFMWAGSSLCQGNRTILVTRFDAEQSLRLIEQYQVSCMYMVPTMMQRIWNLPEPTRLKYDLSSLKAFMHMAAPCPPWLKEAFINWLGPDVVWELYGGTEGQGFTIITGQEWLAHRGSVGRAVEGFCEIAIFDEKGSALPPGEIGEIFMRPVSGAGSTYKYIGAETNIIEDGWDSIGDMGYLDEDGYLYLADRRTDLILCGGANIYPAEVEAAIDAFPGVRSSAVIGLPHDDLGSYVHAIVDVDAAEVSESQLMEFLGERLVRYKLPRSIEFVGDSLRDDAGKLRRKLLREQRLDKR